MGELNGKRTSERVIERNWVTETEILTDGHKVICQKFNSIMMIRRKTHTTHTLRVCIGTSGHKKGKNTRKSSVCASTNLSTKFAQIHTKTCSYSHSASLAPIQSHCVPSIKKSQRFTRNSPNVSISICVSACMFICCMTVSAFFAYHSFSQFKYVFTQNELITLSIFTFAFGKVEFSSGLIFFIDQEK